MKALIAATGLFLTVAVIPSTISAQWPAYPTPSTPKNADGKVNAAAPTPRTPDGKPDLSGLWVNGGFGGGRGRGQQPPAPPPEGPPRANFGNIGAGFKDGLPFTPWAADLRKQRMANNSKDNPDARCLPMGFMQFHNHPQPRKMIQTPGLLVIIYEANYGLRQIFLDGRSLPGKDANPFWYGYSVGKWDGDTLVVETTGFRDGVWLDVQGSPLTETGKVTERFRRPTYGTLEIDITIEDPKAYTQPFTVRVNQQIRADEELIEFICHENDQFTSYLDGKFKPTAQQH